MDNMNLWRSVCVTAPHAVKAITGKQYKGNSPKPYWIIQRATETFGPCGIGWGVTVVSERFERLTDTDVLHVALVRVWYMQDGKRGEVEQMGQTKASYKTKDGGTMVDEDAPKKSVTDGMVKCLSMVGFAGDIFSGQWDDSKYVQWAGEETARRENPPPPRINDKQAADVDALIQEVGADKVAFLAWVASMAGHEVAQVSHIPAAAMSKVISTLEKKRKNESTLKKEAA